MHIEAAGGVPAPEWNQTWLVRTGEAGHALGSCVENHVVALCYRLCSRTPEP